MHMAQLACGLHAYGPTCLRPSCISPALPHVCVLTLTCFPAAHAVLCPCSHAVSVMRVHMSKQSLAALGPGDLAALAWSCAQVTRMPRTRMLAAGIARPLGQSGMLQLAPTRLRFRLKGSWARRFLAASCAQMEYMTPKEVSMLLWALPRLRVLPSAAWSRTVANRMALGAGVGPGQGGHYPYLLAASNQDLALLAYYSAPLGVRHAAVWMEAYLAEVLRRAMGGTLNARCTLGIMCGLAEQRYAPSTAWLTAFLAACTHALRDMSGAQRDRLLLAVATLNPALVHRYGPGFQALLETGAPEQEGLLAST